MAVRIVSRRSPPIAAHSPIVRVSGQESAGIVAVSTPPGGGGSPTYPNRPSGLTELVTFNGSVKRGGTGGTHAFGNDAFGNWSAPNESTIQVVSDPTNPSGSGQSLRFTYLTSGEAGESTANTFPGGPYRRLYVLMRIFMEVSGWNTFGHKFFYFGAALGSRHLGGGFGSPTQFYNDRTGGAPYRLVNQNIGSVVVTRSDRPPPEGGSIAFPAFGQWVTLEHLLIAETTPGAGNGRGASWINGVAAGDRSNVTWIPAGAPANGFDGIHWYAHANSVPVESYYRLGELYIAGGN